MTLRCSRCTLREFAQLAAIFGDGDPLFAQVVDQVLSELQVIIYIYNIYM